MRKGFSVSLLLFSILGMAACSPQSSSRDLASTFQGAQIIGGQPVALMSPITRSIVAVYDSSEGQLCTGSLLPNNIVVTAAHCIGPIPSAMFVIFDVKVTTDSLMRQADQVRVSPLWASRRQEETNTGDIALIHFTGDVPSGYSAASILPHPKFLQNGSKVIVAGFGLSDVASRDTAGTLRQTTLTVDDINYSETEVKLDQRSGSGACHGDSGGPAYLTIAGHNFLWGVTSRGVNDDSGNCNSFSAYTNILSYRAWINKAATEMTKN